MTDAGPAVFSPPPSPTQPTSRTLSLSISTARSQDGSGDDRDEHTNDADELAAVVVSEEEGHYHTADASPVSPPTPPSEASCLMTAEQQREFRRLLKRIALTPLAYEGPEPIKSILERAEGQGLTWPLVEAARDAYEKAAPQLEAKRRIRRAIATVDATELRRCVLNVRHDVSGLAAEVEGAMLLLKLLVWEAQLTRIAARVGGGAGWGVAMGPLSDEVRDACERVNRLEDTKSASASDNHDDTADAAAAALVGLVGSQARADVTLRRFRWSRLAMHKGQEEAKAHPPRQRTAEAAAKARERQARRREAAVQSMIEAGMKRNTLRRPRSEAELQLEASRRALRAAREESAYLGSVLAVDKDFRRRWR